MVAERDEQSGPQEIPGKAKKEWPFMVWIGIGIVAGVITRFLLE